MQEGKKLKGREDSTLVSPCILVFLELTMSGKQFSFSFSFLIFFLLICEERMRKSRRG